MAAALIQTMIAKIRRHLKKSALLSLVLLAVCFPYPQVAWRHLAHFRDPQAMIDPASPKVAPLVEELRVAIATAQSDRANHGEFDPNRIKLDVVESFVRQRIAYAFDWDVWGNVDYLPTVEEVLERKREDCDGQAVLAASLLEAMGVEARLIGNTTHIWVWTPIGETMGPQQTKAVEVTPEGLQFSWRGILELPRTLAFGIAVFPLMRELILVAAIWLLWLRSGIDARTSAICGILLVGSLLMLRRGGHPLQYGWITAGVVLLGVAVKIAASARKRSANSSVATDASQGEVIHDA